MLPIPKLVFEKMTKYNVSFPSLESKFNLEGLALFIFFINSGINPVLYAFLSLRNRQSIRRACHRFGEMTSSKFWALSKSSKFSNGNVDGSHSFVGPKSEVSRLKKRENIHDSNNSIERFNESQL